MSATSAMARAVDAETDQPDLLKDDSSLETIELVLKFYQNPILGWSQEYLGDILNQLV